MILTIIGLIISLISPVVAILLYIENKKFVLRLSTNNLKFLDKLHAEKIYLEKTANIINSFLQMVNASKDTGISALIKSGIKSLDKEYQMEYVISAIKDRTGKDPLGQYAAQIKQKGFLNFFQIIDLKTLKTDNGIEKLLGS